MDAARLERDAKMLTGISAEGLRTIRRLLDRLEGELPHVLAAHPRIPPPTFANRLQSLKEIVEARSTEADNEDQAG